MPAVTIKNIPEDIYLKLKQQAKMNRRSLNSEVIVLIERAVGSHRPSPELVLARARELRALTEGHPISDSDFTEAKKAGRP